MRLQKMFNHYTFTLKMATAAFTKMLDNSQHSTWLTSKSQNYTLIYSHEKLRTRISQCYTVLNNRKIGMMNWVVCERK
jgi:hypothetical protein